MLPFLFYTYTERDVGLMKLRAGCVRIFLAVAAAVVFAACADASVTVVMKAPAGYKQQGVLPAAAARSIQHAAVAAAELADGVVEEVYENLAVDGYVLVRMNAMTNEDAFVAALARSSNVISVTRDSDITVHAVGESRPVYPKVRAAEVELHLLSYLYNTKMVDAPLDGVDVSQSITYVLDSGLDSTHPGVRPFLTTLNRSFIDEEPGKKKEGLPDWQDYEGHGTGVSGTVAADGSISGIIGVAKGSEIAMFKILNASGRGRQDHMLRGLNALAGERFSGVRAVNMSFGFYSNNSPNKIRKHPVYIAYKALNDMRRFVLVAAAGNEQNIVGKPIDRDPPAGVNWKRGDYAYPGSFTGLKNLVTVASVNGDGAASDFTNYGSTALQFQAPGSKVLVLHSLTDTKFQSDIGIGDGTSISAPHIAAMVTVLAAKNPTATPGQLIGLLKGGIKLPPVEKNGEKICMYGMPSLRMAAGATTLPEDPTPPNTPPASTDVPSTPQKPNPPMIPDPGPTPNPNLPAIPDPNIPPNQRAASGGGGCDAGWGGLTLAFIGALLLRKSA